MDIENILDTYSCPVLLLCIWRNTLTAHLPEIVTPSLQLFRAHYPFWQLTNMNNVSNERKIVEPHSLSTGRVEQKFQEVSVARKGTAASTSNSGSSLFCDIPGVAITIPSLSTNICPFCTVPAEDVDTSQLLWTYLSLAVVGSMHLRDTGLHHGRSHDI